MDNLYTLMLASLLMATTSLSSMVLTEYGSKNVGTGVTYNSIVVEKDDLVIIGVASKKGSSVTMDFTSSSGDYFTILSTSDDGDNPKRPAFLGYATICQDGTFDFSITPSANAQNGTKAFLYVLSPENGNQVFPFSTIEKIFAYNTDPSGTFELDYPINETGLGEVVFFESVSINNGTVSTDGSNQLVLDVTVNERKIGHLEETDPASRSSGWTFPTSNSNEGSAIGVGFTETFPGFDMSQDLFLAQFDLKPDPDDIHAAAALACRVEHEDFIGLDYHVYAGTYGIQTGDFIQEAYTLGMFDTYFGASNWTMVKDENGAVANYNAVVQDAAARAAATINAGGRVWVQEAGQSEFTLDWVNELISDSNGVNASDVKYNVLVVQHSWWNEGLNGFITTTAGVLDSLRSLVTYIEIDDGNFLPGVVFSYWTDRGLDTPCFNSHYSEPDGSLNGGTIHPNVLDLLGTAKGEPGYPANPNTRAAEIWTKADEVADSLGLTGANSPIANGGVDFSDDAEAWFIFDEHDEICSIDEFWDKYVTNTPAGSGSQQPYNGSPWVLPSATIQAEQFDIGGEGVAYSDADVGNNGGAFRPDEGVDIGTKGSGYVIGWTRDGEYLEYTVSMPAGTYDIRASVASAIEEAGRQIEVYQDGESTPIAVIDVPTTISSTPAWDSYATISVKNIPFTASTNRVIRFKIIGGRFNIDWFKIRL